MRFEGSLTSWNEKRGFGFIQADHGGQEIFVHIKALPGKPQLGLRLTFDIAMANNKKRATNVQLIRAVRPARQLRRDAPAQWGTASYFSLLAFAMIYLAVAVTWRVPHWAALLYAAVSIVSFGAYGLDKAAAQAGRWRTPESTLLLLGLAGGWPGALLAQQWLRHKSNKASFLRQFWFTVTLNIAAFCYLNSPLSPWSH